MSSEKGMSGSPPKENHSPPKVAEDDAAVSEQKRKEFEKKKQTFIVRAIWTFIMIGLFISIVVAGHVYIAALVMVLQILSYREVINITGDPRHFEQLPWGRTLSWYFCVVVMFYQKGESLFAFLGNVGILDRVLYPVYQYHRFLSYLLYIFGFLFFVGTLRKGLYREQYAQFCTIHMSLFLVVIQGHFIESNILHGVFWFLIPVSLVVVNDIAAYLCGITMGRTPLIEISPKKTVEGFVGAWVCTVVFGVFVTWASYQSYYMICPMDRLGVSAFSNWSCTPNPIFVPTEWRPLSWVNPDFVLVFPPVFLHASVLATFASLIAPFGGFFASGTKRAFKVKDFGDTIPGHGGITDRFDCQFVMGFFAWIYYDTFIAIPPPPSQQILDLHAVLQAALALNPSDQQKLLDDLLRYGAPAVAAIMENIH